MGYLTFKTLDYAFSHHKTPNYLRLIFQMNQKLTAEVPHGELTRQYNKFDRTFLQD